MRVGVPSTPSIDPVFARAASSPSCRGGAALPFAGPGVGMALARDTRRAGLRRGGWGRRQPSRLPASEPATAPQLYYMCCSWAVDNLWITLPRARVEAEENRPLGKSYPQLYYLYYGRKPRNTRIWGVVQVVKLWITFCRHARARQAVQCARATTARARAGLSRARGKVIHKLSTGAAATWR
jgi:hypothetical protein